MARKYDVKGTKDFLYWSIGLTVLCVWFARDGWFPPQSKIDAKTASELAHFVLFNKSVAVITAIAAVVTGYIHKVVK